MTVDLHLHSKASDGTESPAQVVRRAVRLGVTTIALTDHDTLAGIAEAKAAAAPLPIDLIPGTELSVDWPTGKMHLLVYFLEPIAGPLQDRLAWLREGRNHRNAAIVNRLQQLGYDVTLAEAEAQAEGPSVGRPHIADALVTKGYFDARGEAFHDLLAIPNTQPFEFRLAFANRGYHFVTDDHADLVPCFLQNRHQFAHDFLRMLGIDLGDQPGNLLPSGGREQVSGHPVHGGGRLMKREVVTGFDIRSRGIKRSAGPVGPGFRRLL